MIIESRKPSDTPELENGELLDDWPFSAFCYLQILNEEGSAKPGSGWILRDGVIVTAAHNLITPSSDYYPAIYVHIGWNGYSSVLRYVGYPANFEAHDDYTHEHDRDIGLIKLDDDIERYTGSVGVEAVSDEEIAYATSGSSWTVTGYARGRAQRSYDGQITKVLPNGFRHNAETKGGDSGGPVWGQRGGDYRAVGVHNRVDRPGRTDASRFLEQDIEWIRNYL